MAVVAVHRPPDDRDRRDEKDDPLDTILKGLQIASSLYGLRTSYEQSLLNEQKLKTETAKADVTGGKAKLAEKKVFDYDDYADKYFAVPEGQTYDNQIPIVDVPVMRRYMYTGPDGKQQEGVRTEVVRSVDKDMFKALFMSQAAHEKYRLQESKAEKKEAVRKAERAEDKAMEKEKFELQKQQAQEAAKIRQLTQQQKEGAEKRIKDSYLVPGYGYARTAQDAKVLLDAVEMKKSMDSKLDEMIKLRIDYGAEFMDRDAIARGRNLATSILLTNKNLEKLGVLSVSDEKLLKRLVPDDPLQVTATTFVGEETPLGKDPIIEGLKKFKNDKDRDFRNKIKLRILTPTDKLEPPPKFTVPRTGPRTNRTKEQKQQAIDAFLNR